MQDTAVRHSDSTGCTRLTNKHGATWVIRTHKIEYFRAAFADDQISLLTWVADFRKVRSLRKYKFVRITDNALLARGETDWLFVDISNGRPKGIPEDVATFTLVPVDQEP